MVSRISKYSLATAIFLYTAYAPAGACAQRPTTVLAPTTKQETAPPGIDHATIDVDVFVAESGAPLKKMAVVTLTARTGQVFGQGTTKAGRIRFTGVTPSVYIVQVVAAGYENAVKDFDGYSTGPAMITVEMHPSPNGSDTAQVASEAALAPKARKEIGKALEALRTSKLAEAKSHLDAGYRLGPNQPEVNYLFGVYFSLLQDQEKAKSYWAKALEFDPRHLPALLSLGKALMRESKLSKAEAYVKRAVDADPSSWRAHAILADVYLQQHAPEESVQQAERALELGHGQAADVPPLLARALVEGGNAERAKAVLLAYIQDHPADAAARKQLEDLKVPVELSVRSGTAAEAKPSMATETAISLPLPSNWLPPDVDERVPLVEPGPACVLEEVVRNAGKRMQEFVEHVDKFTATENLVHTTVDKFGVSSSPETRKFNYVVSIRESRPGLFSVDEYRVSPNNENEFPGGVATYGLPSLALIFHPFNAENFEMSCEGLGRSGGGLAWQIHFRQRSDRPNTMRAYKLGVNGPSYPVALRGRAWIAADSYQVVRIETDLVTPIPQIRLFADHTAIEYGPVRFRNRNVEMWLPQSAEVYYDWRGRRSHRRHSFSNYLLFSVEEKQFISQPKTLD